MRALVTGGAGFIGSHVADRLIERGMDVVVLDDLSTGYMDNVPQGATFVKDTVAMSRRVFAEYGPFDYVYHLAAYAAETVSHERRAHTYYNNVCQTSKLVEASLAQDVGCFVFASSIAVYGGLKRPYTALREDDIPQPLDPYGVSKYTVEMDLEAAMRRYGMPYIVFRPHNVYGPRQSLWDPNRNVVGIFLRKLLEGDPLIIYGDGEQTRQFTYIDDIAPVIADAALDRDFYGRVFNIGADKVWTVGNMAKELLAAARREWHGTREVPYDYPIEHVASRKEAKHAYADHSRLMAMGCCSETDLFAGLKMTARWAIDVWSERQEGAQ
jgi:UDP-glucose 4-epimerase